MAGLDPATLLVVWEQGRHGHALHQALTLLSAATPAGVPVSGWDLASRDALLATVLAGYTGWTVWGCSSCTGCGLSLDVPVDLGAVARAPLRAPGERLTTTVGGVDLPFRLPTTEDLLLLPATDPAAARRALVARCTGLDEIEVSDELADAVETAMELAAPTGAVEFAVSCPGCTATTAAALDVPALLWAEVERRALALLRDVHTLATVYGWTQADVLALSPTRRAAYLELIGSAGLTG